MSTETQTRKIPLGRPVFDKQEVEANTKVFDSPWVINGPEVRKFEEVFKKYTNTTNASAVSSCTAGMHLALIAAGVKKGDEVLLPAFNFIADGLSVLQAGGEAVFTDIDPTTSNMDPASLKKKITSKSKAILVLHYAGFPSPMDDIMAIAKEHGLKVIEDASHALGSGYGDKKIGAIGDATSFSFGPLKMICTGMGGMVTSNDKALVDKVNSLRSYGMDKSMWDRREDAKPWSYSVGELGHNFRMTDFQAALGIVQMSKLGAFVAERKKISNQYQEGLNEIGGFEFFKPVPKADPVPLYFAVKVKNKETRDNLGLYLVQQGIGASVHWDIPLPEHGLFKHCKQKPSEWPASQEVANRVLSLPLYPAMTTEDVNYILDKIRTFTKKGN